MRVYELWNDETGNLLAYGEAEEILLETVRSMIAAHGRDAINEWSLVWSDDEDEEAGGILAEGEDLAQRAWPHVEPATHVRQP